MSYTIIMTHIMDLIYELIPRHVPRRLRKGKLINYHLVTTTQSKLTLKE